MMWDIPQMVTSVSGILDKVIPDKDAREKAAHEISLALIAQEQAQDAGQTDINKVEAGSSNLFVSGWRPFIGWVGGSALAWQFVLYPIITYGLAVWGRPVALPYIPTDQLFNLVLAMLGLGGMRTFEKIKGVTR